MESQKNKIQWRDIWKINLIKNSHRKNANSIVEKIDDQNNIGSESLAFNDFEKINLLKTQKISNDSLFKVHYINAKKLDIISLSNLDIENKNTINIQSKIHKKELYKDYSENNSMSEGNNSLDSCNLEKINDKSKTNNINEENKINKAENKNNNHETDENSEKTDQSNTLSFLTSVKANKDFIQMEQAHKYICELLTCNKEKKIEMIFNPIPYSIGMLKFSIRRFQSKFGKRANPKYELLWGKHFRFLLCAKKRSFNVSSNYLFSLDRENASVEKEGYIGKIRSNFLGTEFNLYDKGKNPKNSINEAELRSQYGTILYKSTILAKKGPREITVVIPKVIDDKITEIFKPKSEEDSISTKFKSEKIENLMIFQNVAPKWIESRKGYFLNFNDRVKFSSVKNFQIINKDSNNSEIKIQFGKIDQDLFSLDIRYPFSVFQGFGIAISSFDNKLACK